MKKLLIIVFLLTISCSTNKVVKYHGFSSLEAKSNDIIISKSNKNDVTNLFGKPSSISLFDENTWFFIQREKVNRSIFRLGKQKTLTNNVLEINFNNYGIVETKKLYNIEDMNELDISKDKTENMAIKKTGINSLFQSLYQKINAPKNRKRNN